MASNLVIEVAAGAVIGGTSILYVAVGESSPRPPAWSTSGQRAAGW